MARVLVSFCNQGAGRPSLAVCDVRHADRVDVVDLPDFGQVGAAGLTRAGDVIAVALQAQPGAPAHLVLLDAETLGVREHWPLSLVADPHSMVWQPDGQGGRLTVASTGTDEVIELELRGEDAPVERVVWRPAGAGRRIDRHHINSVALHEDQLIVAGFWPKVGRHWASALQGKVVVAETDEVLQDGLRHPHSLVSIDADLWLCESSGATVQMVGGAAGRTLPGYTRGLCVLGGDQLMVGTSVGRKTSRSLGISNPGDPGQVAGACCLLVLARPALQPVQVVKLGHLTSEIYDILPLDG